MESPAVGDLVKVSTGGPPADGIVFDIPSAQKVVVAIVDPRRGPVLRTVRPGTLSVRTTEGAHDVALRQLIRRRPPPGQRTVRGGPSGGRGRAGHTRGATHRTSDH
jgi:hypothetical protein